jgi:hypothetical protein
VQDSCEHGNELSGSVECWEILEWLSDWRLLEKCAAALLCFFFPWFILRPRKWRRNVPPKRRLPFSGLHGVSSLKSEL